MKVVEETKELHQELDLLQRIGYLGFEGSGKAFHGLALKELEGFPRLGVPYLRVFKVRKDYNIMGPVLGSPYFGKPPLKLP